MKKALALLLALMMIIGVIAGCAAPAGQSSDATQNGDAQEAADDGEEAAPAEEGDTASNQEPYTVRLVLPGDSKSEDVAEISEAASKILKEKFNTTLEIVRLGWGDFQNQCNLMLSSDEQVDLMYSNRDLFVTAVNSGQILDFTPYFDEYGQDIKELISQSRWDSVTVNGGIYALPAQKDTSVSYGFICVKEMADATGVDYSNIKTVEDLEPLLEAVHEMYPDVYTVAPYSNSFMETIDSLGGDRLGVLEDVTDSSTTVVNWFDSDRFKELCDIAWGYTQKGYTMPDATANTIQNSTLISSGKAFGYFGNTKPGMETEVKQGTGMDMLVFTLTPVFTSTVRNDILWYIPHNSKDPGRAMQVLNELYINPELENICVYGIEGKHWEFKDEENGIIGYPEGVDGTNTGYPGYAWAWPNEFILYTWEGNDADIWEKTKEWNDSAVVSPANGFSWDNANVMNQVTACQNVVDKYASALLNGSIDPATSIPEFNKELEAAGINDIIEEKQRQIDEWLANK